MRNVTLAAAVAIGVMSGFGGRAWMYTDGEKLPIAGQAPAKDFAGARELPDPGTDYKVVFSVAANAKDEEVHPTLKTIALYLNTLAHNGVPANHRHIVAVFHQGGGDAVLANDVYKSRHKGRGESKHRHAENAERCRRRAARVRAGVAREEAGAVAAAAGRAG